MHRLLILLVLLLAAGAAPVRAASATASCTGFVTAMPFTIDAPGTWCVVADLTWSAAVPHTGITINARDVVLDCNGFLLAGPVAPDTSAYGIFGSMGHLTIRNCNIRGFALGIFLYGDGVLLENNRIQQSTQRGIYLQGQNNLVRGNHISRIGGSDPPLQWAIGMSTFGDVDILDNTISDIVATPGSNERAWGISVGDDLNEPDPGPDSVTIRGNRVRGVAADGSGEGSSLFVFVEGSAVLRDNIVVGPSAGAGLRCDSNALTHVSGNVVLGAATLNSGCVDDGGNTLKP